MRRNALKPCVRRSGSRCSLRTVPANRLARGVHLQQVIEGCRVVPCANGGAEEALLFSGALESGLSQHEYTVIVTEVDVRSLGIARISSHSVQDRNLKIAGCCRFVPDADAQA